MDPEQAIPEGNIAKHGQNCMQKVKISSPLVPELSVSMLEGSRVVAYFL